MQVGAQFLCEAHHSSAKDCGTGLIAAAKESTDGLSDAPLLHLQDHFSRWRQTVSLTERKTNACSRFSELRSAVIFYLCIIHNPFILCSKSFLLRIRISCKWICTGFMDWTRCLISHGCSHWTREIIQTVQLWYGECHNYMFYCKSLIRQSICCFACSSPII